MSLRDAIKEKHDKAEQHRFVTLLLSGDMPDKIYADFLANQAACYEALEAKIYAHGMFDGIEELYRTPRIWRDFYELACSANMYPSTKEYVRYLEWVQPDQLWAHVYGRHFADLFGGQIIKKVAPGSCTMYDFEGRAELVKKDREKLSDDLADEANKVFDFALNLFDEVANAHNI